MPIAEPASERAAIDARLQAAARAGNARALTQAYRQAADIAVGEDATGFFLTHAYVWALVAGDALTARRLAKELRRRGRLD